MNPNEILDLVLEGMKFVAMGAGGYALLFPTLSLAGRIFSQRIESQQELERITKIEIEKLGIQKEVKAIFQECGSDAGKLDDETYEIALARYSARRNIVRHELYHIYRGHCDTWKEKGLHPINILDYLFRQEPQAVMYEVFRIKL